MVTDAETPDAGRARPGLAAALNALGPGDVLVVCSFDCLGRSLIDLLAIIQRIGDRGAGFRAIVEDVDTTRPGGACVLHFAGALAGFERRMIVGRVNAGVLAAKRQGKHFGRPRKLTDEQIRQAREALSRGGASVGSVASFLGVSRSTLWRALNGGPAQPDAGDAGDGADV